MGTLHVALWEVENRAITGATLPVAKAVPAAAATLDTTTTSARVGALEAAGPGQVWVCTAVGADIYVRASAAAASTAAGPNQGHLIPAGATVALGVTAAGQQMAARDRA